MLAVNSFTESISAAIEYSEMGIRLFPCVDAVMKTNKLQTPPRLRRRVERKGTFFI